MAPVVKPVEEFVYSTKDEFLKYITVTRKPLLIRGLDIGECKTKWSVNYLSQTIKQLNVTVHVSSTGKMSFLKKNVTYVKLPFDEFLHRASGENLIMYKPLLCENEVLYYRSISFDRRGRECSDINKHFPQISEDFNLPSLFNQEDFFSSVFRIASPGVQVWTHYDIMDNILVQIRGTKRVVLFDPKDVNFLYMNGDKSEVIDIDNPDIKKYPLFLNAVQHECILHPGDAIFIPALWFHNTISHNFSISINVFWKNLPHEYYDKNDVYGNKDLVPATKAFIHINKGLNLLNSLPVEYKHFYINRCIQDMKKILNESSQERSSEEIEDNGLQSLSLKNTCINLSNGNNANRLPES